MIGSSAALLGGALALLVALSGWLWLSLGRSRSRAALANETLAAERARMAAEIVSLQERLSTGERERTIAAAGRAGVMDAAFGPLFLTDVEGRILEANRAATEAFGIEADQARNVGELAILPPSVEPAGSGLAWHLSSGSAALFDRRVEVEARGVSGSFPAELTVRPMAAEGRRLFAIALRDLSSERKMARELDRMRHLRSATTDSVTEGILSIDTQGHVTTCNRRFLQMWGVPSSLEVIQDLEQLLSHLSSQLKTPDAFSAEMAFVKKRPEAEHYGVLELTNDRSIEHTTRPFLIDGRVAGRVWTFRDVTERRRSAESLGRFADIVQNMQIGLVVYRLEEATDDHTLRILTVNPAACRILGFSARDLVGRLVDERFPRLRDRGIPAIYANVANGDAPIDFEFALPVTGGGREKAMSVRAFPLPGRSVGVAMEDITERKAVERLKNEFVSIVSHELRTPLTSIRGSLGLLQGGVVGVLPEAAKELVEIAQSNSERLLRLINDILDIEKIEAGKFELRFVELGCEGLVAMSLASIRGMAEQANVRLVDELAGKGPEKPIAAPVVPRVRGDEDRLIQVLSNLLSNAIKFSPSGSEVRVRVESVGGGEAVRFVVADRGPGIPDEKRSRLFGKFQQIDSSDTRQKGGTGLGLAISKAIVERHGGVIGVDSRPGDGSAFWFELPAAARATVSSTGRIVLVDDEVASASSSNSAFSSSPERTP